MTVDPSTRSEGLTDAWISGSAMESGENLPGASIVTELKRESRDRIFMDSGELLRAAETKRSAEKSTNRRFSAELKRLSWEDWKFPFVHHQVLKIREEDSHLGEDFGEGLSAKEKLALFHLRRKVDALLCSQRVLRSSPLGNKTAIESVQ